MSLTVTSGPSALAVLQSLSAQASTSSASISSGSAAAASSTTSSSSVAASGPARSQGLFAIAEGVGQALSAADAADAAGQGVMGLLQQMRAAAGQAADPTASDQDRTGLDQQFQASAGQIAPTLAGATVNGVNLVDGSLSSGLKVTLGEGATASLTPVDLTLGGSTLGAAGSASIASADDAASAFTSLGEAIGSAGAALGTLQTQADQIGAHAGFVQTLGQVLASPSQDGGDSVRLMALQVSQQLSTQTSAIANQAPQSILSLFRS